MLQFRAGLDALKTYSIEEGEWAVKLDANECSLGMPPSVQERLTRRLASLPFNRYPEITPYGLKRKIADDLGLVAENISIGNGSSELLQALCFIFGGVGRKQVFPQPSFSMYPIYCRLADSEPVVVELEPDFSLPPEKILAAAKRAQANMIILCTPNNPTGNVMSAAEVEAVVSAADCPVVVDEAYWEFHGESALGLVLKYPNVIVARTFSKAYGLASARVGYAIASREITAAVGKVTMPFHVNMLSLAAAEIVYDHKDKFADNIARIASERDRLTIELAQLPGVTVYPSRTNFVLFKTSQAEELNKRLLARGICIRHFGNAPRLENCLRVTVGSKTENDSLLQTAKDFLLK